MLDQAVELIDKTIEVLERDGWRKGAYVYYHQAPHCLVGALHIAAYGYGNDCGIASLDIATDALYAYTYRRIAEHLGAHYGAGALMEPEAWNDVVPKCKADVIEMLQHCKFHSRRDAEMAVRPWPERQKVSA